MIRSRSALLLALFLAACDSSVAAPPAEPEPSVPVVTARPAVRISLSTYRRSLDIVGMNLQLIVLAFDAEGRRTSSDRVRATSSNTDVAVIRGVQTFDIDESTGPSWRAGNVLVQRIGAGETTIRADLDGVTDSIRIRVQPFPVRPAALVVDTFTVLEYQATCAFNCPYLVYAPLLRLREPTGTSTAVVEAVEFSIPTKTTGLCTVDGLSFTPGLSAHVNGIDPYLWANDMIFVNLDGMAVPEGVATARVIVRGAGGELGLIEVSAPIQRVARGPTLPPPNTSVGWNCVSVSQ